MNHLILLAAGSSRRFGGNKLLAPLHGKPLYAWGLSALHDVCQERGGCTLTVVSRYPEIRAAARALGAQAVDSPDSEKGQSYSIRAGLQALGRVEERDFLLFLPADQPWITPKTISRLLDAAGPDTWTVTAAFGERVGTPTLFSARLLPDLLALEGDRGGRKLMGRPGEPCLVIQAGSERELDDVDFPEQLQ